MKEITGIDIVQSQILIASGKTLPELGLIQEDIPEPTSYAMQCRVVSDVASVLRYFCMDHRDYYIEFLM